MANIKAADVAKLRKATGAGMMDCKNALVETDGNFEDAIDIIRKKGQAIANKRADRDAAEGCVLSQVSEDGKTGMIVVVNCETDFVAKNDKFVKFTNDILELAMSNNCKTIEDVKGLDFEGRTVEAQVLEQNGIIGEKVEFSYFARIDSENVVPYIHAGNKLATLVGFNETLADIQIGKDVAMQVAAMNPVAVDKGDVSKEVIEKEIEIGKEQARQEGKPENLIEKIAMGKLGKFYKENTLLNQAFVKDNKKTITQYLKESSKDLTVTEFNRYSLNA